MRREWPSGQSAGLWVGRPGFKSWMGHYVVALSKSLHVKPEVPSPAGFGVGDLNFPRTRLLCDGCPPLVPSPAGFGVGFPRTRLGWVGWVGRVGGWVASLTLLHLLGKDVKPEVPSPAGFGVGDVNFPRWVGLGWVGWWLLCDGCP